LDLRVSRTDFRTPSASTLAAAVVVHSVPRVVELALADELAFADALADAFADARALAVADDDAWFGFATITPSCSLEAASFDAGWPSAPATRNPVINSPPAARFIAVLPGMVTLLSIVRLRSPCFYSGHAGAIVVPPASMSLRGG
jgi:hypothetical protein